MNVKNTLKCHIVYKLTKCFTWSHKAAKSIVVSVETGALRDDCGASLSFMEYLKTEEVNNKRTTC